MLEVQKYLKEKTLADLKAELGIKVREYPEDNLVLLDYNQIESPKTHPITIECRSLILALDTFDVVSRKFDRFFNLGEAPETVVDFDFSDATVMEKADGSIVGVYHNPHTDRWEVSTRGMAKAEGEHMFGGTWREKIIQAMGLYDEETFQSYFTEVLTKDNTLILEYCSPENRIVTKYEYAHVVFLGTRDRTTGEDFDYLTCECVVENVLSDLNIRMPRVYDATKDGAALVELANSLQNLEEGFVVRCNKTGKRVKIKSKTYLVAHKLRGESAVPTRKNIMNLVLEGEVDEFLAYFPEWTQLIREAQAEIGAIEDGLNQHWWNIATGMDLSQKDFALAVKDEKCAWAFFQARKNNSHPVDEFRKAQIMQKLKALGV